MKLKTLLGNIHPYRKSEQKILLEKESFGIEHLLGYKISSAYIRINNFEEYLVKYERGLTK